MAFPGDPQRPYDPARDAPYARDPYPPTRATPPPYPNTAPYPTRTDVHDERYERRGGDMPREVTAGAYRFSIGDALVGTIGLFAILGLVLGVLGFGAAFALDEARDLAAANNDAEAAANALPALLVSLLPFMAAPVLALGLGAWAGHASRNTSMGALAGAVGCFVGPIVMLIVSGIGFALGAGAANLDLSTVPVPDIGVAPGWGTTIPYLFTGAGLLWLFATTLAGGLAGGMVGGILDGRWTTRRAERRAYTRRTSRI